MLRVFGRLGVRNWLLMAVCTVFIVLQVWLDLKLPDYMSDITRLVETDGSKMSEVWEAGWKMLGVSAASMGCAIVSSLIAAIIAAQVSKDLRKAQFDRVEQFGPEEIDRFSTPSLVTRATNDVTQIQMFLVMGLVLIVRAPVMAIWAIVKIAGKGIEWTEATGLALGLLLLMVAVLVVTCLPKFKAMQALTDDVSRVARENLTGLKTIRAFNAESYQQKRFEKANDALTETQLYTSRMTAGIMPFMTLVMDGLSMVIYWIGAFLLNKSSFDVTCSKPSIPDEYMAAMKSKEMATQLAMSGRIDPTKIQSYADSMQTYASCMKNGASQFKDVIESRIDVFSNMVVFSQYAMQVIMAFLLCAMLFVLWPRAQASAKRIWEVIDTVPGIQGGGKTLKSVDAEGNKHGSLKLVNVSYTYPGKTEPDLEGINVSVEPGETLGIIGSTGSGKSTLAALIPRLREADSGGAVMVDGLPVKEWDDHALRHSIGYVTQKAIMLKGTIRDNIELGVDSDAERHDGKNPDELDKWAADVAQATEFIESKDKGMDSIVTQGGDNLSGGQKQRLNIARAVRTRPEILILDDSTSALDMATDARLRASLKSELKGTTVVMIAQRVSSIMDADKILVLDNGKQIGLGTHSELMKDCPDYREIAEGQLGEEAWNNGR